MGEMPKYKLNPDAASSSANGNGEQMWSPFGFFFSNALSAKCDLCGKRLGRKPVLECDDCGLRQVLCLLSGIWDFTHGFHRAHIKCGEMAPMDCGLCSARAIVQQTVLPTSPKGKQVAKAQSRSPARTR